MLIDLTGKVAIVTGAGRGIGRVIAATLVKEGVKTVITDINPETLKDAERELKENGGECRGFLCDVRNAAQIQETADAIVAEFGRIDILVNNAGVARSKSVAEMSEEDWDLVQESNLKGTFLMCRAVVPVMKRQKSGRIINAASFAAIVPSMGSAAYASAKAGVHYFTRALAGEMGPYNVTVNCYAPGMIPSQMNNFDKAPPERQARLLDTLTLRRWGKEEEIANLVCFLASDLAGYITGTMIDASGGKLATQIPIVAYEQAAKEAEAGE